MKQKSFNFKISEKTEESEERVINLYSDSFPYVDSFGIGTVLNFEGQPKPFNKQQQGLWSITKILEQGVAMYTGGDYVVYAVEQISIDKVKKHDLYHFNFQIREENTICLRETHFPYVESLGNGTVLHLETMGQEGLWEITGVIIEGVAPDGIDYSNYRIEEIEN
jgi:hypothetical protein